MWIFTRYGFYSVVCARNGDGVVDPGNVWVRARAERHLVDLKARFPVLAEVPVAFTPEADYSFRLVIAKATWADILTQLGMELDWTNFRNEVAAYQGAAGRHYLDAIHDVWDRMAHL